MSINPNSISNLSSIQNDLSTQTVQGQVQNIQPPTLSSNVTDKIDQATTITSSTELKTYNVTQTTSQSTFEAFLQSVKDFFQAIYYFLFDTSDAKSLAESTKKLNDSSQQTPFKIKENFKEVLEPALNTVEQKIDNKMQKTANRDETISYKFSKEYITYIKKQFGIPLEDKNNINENDLYTNTDIKTIQKNLQECLECHQALQTLEKNILQQCEKQSYDSSKIDFKTCDSWKDQLNSNQVAVDNKVWNLLQKRHTDCSRVAFFALPLFKKAYQANELSISELQNLKTKLKDQKMNVTRQLTGNVLSKGVASAFDKALQKVDERIFNAQYIPQVEKDLDTFETNILKQCNTGRLDPKKLLGQCDQWQTQLFNDKLTETNPLWNTLKDRYSFYVYISRSFLMIQDVNTEEVPTELQKLQGYLKNAKASIMSELGKLPENIQNKFSKLLGPVFDNAIGKAKLKFYYMRACADEGRHDLMNKTTDFLNFMKNMINNNKGKPVYFKNAFAVFIKENKVEDTHQEKP